MAVIASVLGLPPYVFHDGGGYSLAALEGSLLEPPVALYLDGVRVDDPATPGPDAYGIVEVYDRVPGTDSWPLTFADIIANGYVRPLVQRADGSTSAFGTSVITGPSFRVAGSGFDLIPEIAQADVQTDASSRVSIAGLGSFGGFVTLVCTRSYPDPEIGRSVIEVAATWVAVQAIDLEGVGFDGLRLATISSMLADADAGLYDGRYIAFESPDGVRTVEEVDDAARGVHLFGAPRPTAVGRSFGVFKDNGAAWNAGSPTIEVRIVSASDNVGLLGVQGYLATTVDPNDDSLNLWLEWLDPPDPLSAGTSVSVELEIVATPPTDIGDIDHDGVIGCADVQAIGGLVGLVGGETGFDTYADLDRDGDVDASDVEMLRSIATPAPGDFNGDWSLDVLDFVAFQRAFVAGDPDADVSGDGVLSILDFVVFQGLFRLGC